MTNKKTLKNIGLVVVSVGLFAFILSRVDLAVLGDILTSANPVFVAAGVALALIQFCVTSLRWQLLLQAKGIRIGYGKLLASIMGGSFISTFFPSKYAGDVYRAYVIAKETGKTYDSAASVILGRLLGLLVQVVMGFGAALFYWAYKGSASLSLAVMGICLGVLLAIGTIFSQKAYEIVDSIFAKLKLEFIRAPFSKFHSAITAYKSDKKILCQALIITVWFNAQAFLLAYCAPLAIHESVPFVFIIFVMPIISIVEALPISLNGLGMREGAFIFFFTKIGVSYESALAISLLFLFYGLAANLVGGLVLLIQRLDLTSDAKKLEKIKL